MTTVDEYMRRSYHLWMVRDEDESGTAWVAGVTELPGCLTQGESPEEAAAMLQDAMRGWLESALDAGFPIPEPDEPPKYSGKLQLRIPRDLHAALAAAAQREGCSLNLYLATHLAADLARSRANQPIALMSRSA